MAGQIRAEQNNVDHFEKKKVFIFLAVIEIKLPLEYFGLHASLFGSSHCHVVAFFASWSLHFFVFLS